MKVLIPVDDSDAARRITEHAAGMAQDQASIAGDRGQVNAQP